MSSAVIPAAEVTEKASAFPPADIIVLLHLKAVEEAVSFT